VEARRD